MVNGDKTGQQLLVSVGAVLDKRHIHHRSDYGESFPLE